MGDVNIDPERIEQIAASLPGPDQHEAQFNAVLQQLRQAWPDTYGQYRAAQAEILFAQAKTALTELQDVARRLREAAAAAKKARDDGGLGFGSQTDAASARVSAGGDAAPPADAGIVGGAAAGANLPEWALDGVPDQYRERISQAKVMQSGRKNASSPEQKWNEELNNPQPNTAYFVDGRMLFVTDHLGRTVYTKAILTRKDPNDGIDRRNNGEQGKAGTQRYDEAAQRRVNLDIPERITGVDDGGHLVAAQFHGIGEAINLVAQNRHQNRSSRRFQKNWFATETAVRKMLEKRGVPVTWEVKIAYQEGSVRPHHLDVTFWQGDPDTGAEIHQRRFPNPAGPPGATAHARDPGTVSPD